MKVHQGDVFLEEVKIPNKKGKVVRNGIVAYGEITGHKHFVENGKIFEIENNEYLFLNVDSVMTHQQHPAAIVPKPKKGNCYKVRIQHEYFPEGLKKVVD